MMCWPPPTGPAHVSLQPDGLWFGYQGDESGRMGFIRGVDLATALAFNAGTYNEYPIWWVDDSTLESLGVELTDDKVGVVAEIPGFQLAVGRAERPGDLRVTEDIR